MKKYSLLLAILCGAFLMGCNKDEKGKGQREGTISLLDGSIIINSHPNVKITTLNSFPEGVATGTSSTTGKMGVKATGDDDPSHLRANDYRFKRVADVSTLTIDGVVVQATHVKIADNYAFVSYNEKGDPHRGGVVVYKFTIHEGSLEDVSVDVEPITSIEMSNAELSALDYYDGKLYMTGASSDKNFGYYYRTDKFNYAFFMVMEITPSMNFKADPPLAIKKLSSFQGTSIRVHKGLVYITTGDGTNNTDGGLYIYDANNFTLVKSILGKEYVRSVDVDDSGIYMMQSEPARLTKFNLDGSGEELIYHQAGEAMQQNAKSEILAWDKYVFVAENESGMRMLLKDNGAVNASLDAPGEDPENEVTNSVCMNSDPKKDSNGKIVQSNLLFLANGEKGIYWYDVMQDSDGKDWIVSSEDNSILVGTGSANFITSRGNIVFVADGLGGLRVLYIGFNSGSKPPPHDGCKDFMGFLYNGNDPAALLPEGRSVFRADANPIIKQLFQQPSVEAAANTVLNYIEIVKETPLYITYILEYAGWSNALGYFEIPAEVARTDQAEFNYWNNTIKPDMYTVVNKVNVLKDKYIVFNNIKDINRGGTLVPGSTYQIGGDNKIFKPGTRVVLFMCPNGWSAQNNRVEVTFTTGTTKQIFFMHKGLNKSTNIPYAAAYGKFAGAQINTFYSADCNSIVLCIEDYHMQGTDVDFNDVILSVSDNLKNEKVTGFVAPKWAVGERIDDSGELVIIPTEDLFNK